MGTGPRGLLTYTPQNSSTDSKVMTSFSSSFQLSP
jgi:hypothetical protein